MSRRPTVYDVAQRAGVSIATVSFAFSQPHRLREATREAVMAAADALGYVPSASARGLATGLTGTIGLYCFEYLAEPAATEPARARSEVAAAASLRRFPLYGDEVQRGVQLECRRRGYAVMLGAGQAAGALPAVVDVAGRVDGLIAFAGSAPPEAISQVSKRIPVVELGGEARHEGLYTVYVDNRRSMHDLTAHLRDVHGCRRFAYLGGEGTPEFLVRYAGFGDALAAAGLSVPEREPTRPADEASTAAAVARYLRDRDLPDAFVCATDQEALAAIDALAAAGVAVPDRVAVTGFDGILAGRFASPRLTTVRQPMAEIGRTAVGLLARVLTGADGPAPDHPPLPVTVTIGASCGCTPHDPA